jgi:hypothetical protein
MGTSIVGKEIGRDSLSQLVVVRSTGTTNYNLESSVNIPLDALAEGVQVFSIQPPWL